MAYTIYYKHNRPASQATVPFDPEYQPYFQNRQTVWEKYGTTRGTGILAEEFLGTDVSPTGEPWKLMPQAVEVTDPTIFQAMQDEIASHPQGNIMHNDCLTNLVTIRYKIVNEDTQEVVSDWSNISNDFTLRA